jgi:BirA family biotin operon repressor/biotin-[acetyl-CoA-carboxylase] ligase
MFPSAPLTIDGIRSTLSTAHIGRQLFLHRELPSTNSEATALAQAGAEHGTVVVAEGQTAGRGRLARTWFSPAGVNLYVSIVIRPRDLRLAYVEWLSWIPLTTALAAREAIRTVAGVSVGLKWPNDLLLNDRKVGGILCESGSDHHQRPFVVIGLGLNANLPPDSFPAELRDIAGSLIERTGRPIDRNRLLAQLLGDIEEALVELSTQGQHRLLHEYTTRCATIGKTVRVHLGEGREIVGVARAIGRDGALHLLPSSPASRPGPPAIVEVRAADVVHLRE